VAEVEINYEGNFTWQIDWALLTNILESNAFHRALLKNSHRRVESQADWNPFSWSMPDLITVEIDWKAHRADTKSFTNDMMAQAKRMAANGRITNLKDFVQTKIAETDTHVSKYKEKVSHASRAAMKQIEKSVSKYDNRIGIAKFIRDRSVDGVLVGATVLSGGAAIAAISGGSVLKGTYSYQDKGNVGLALLETGSTLIVSVIPIGIASRAATTGLKQTVGEKAALVVIETQLDTIKGLVDGETLKQAASRAITKAASGVVLGKIMDMDGVGGLLDKVALPMSKVTMDGSTRVLTSKEISNMTGDFYGKLIGSQTVDRAGDAVAEAIGPNAEKNNAGKAQIKVSNHYGACTMSTRACANMVALDRAIQKIGTVGM